MPARQHTPRSGSPLLADLPRASAVKVIAHDNGYDDAASPIKPIELKSKVAPRDAQRRASASFAAPLRDSFRESFFDLAQRYQSLRDAARGATRAKKAAALLTPAMRERRLTDLPPPNFDDTSDVREQLEPPEEPTLVQPLASRAPEHPAPPASERRPTTVRPPPPPDPLPRMLMPSTMPPPMTLSASVPPPPAPPSVWRPMLAAAALSATIGALVSGGVVAMRGFSTPRPAAASVVTPVNTSEASTAAPCPVGAAPSTPGGVAATSGGSLPSTTTGGSVMASTSFTSRTPSASSDGSPTSVQNGAPPMQVSIDNLPLESASKSGSGAHPSVLPANAFAHVTPVTITRAEGSTSTRSAAPAITRAEASTTRATATERAAERKRAKREAAAAALAARESQKASDDSDDDENKPAAAPPPPPAPTKGPDRAAIAKAVGRAAAAAMACDSGPRQGRAVITFAPSGNVQSVGLVESFGDNAVNGCVLRALGRAHVPPFVGGPIEVRKGLSW